MKYLDDCEWLEVCINKRLVHAIEDNAGDSLYAYVEKLLRLWLAQDDGTL